MRPSRRSSLSDAHQGFHAVRVHRRTVSEPGNPGRLALYVKFLEEVLLEQQHDALVGKRLSGYQENVFRPVSKRVDLGRPEVHVISGKHAGNAIKKPRAVARD